MQGNKQAMVLLKWRWSVREMKRAVNCVQKWYTTFVFKVICDNELNKN